jgi:hypothetical protein
LALAGAAQREVLVTTTTTDQDLQLLFGGLLSVGTANYASILIEKVA